MPDKEITEQLRHGDENAFRQLVTMYQQKVYNTSLNFLQSTEDAEDVAQEVFIQVYHAIHQFKENSSLSTWIYRITVSKCLDHIRSRKRKKRFAVISSLFTNDNKPVHEPVEFNHPGVQLDRKSDAAILFREIDRLSENQKTAFLLNKIDGLSYREIGSIMDITESAVDSLIQRARQNLKKNLDKKF